MRLNKWTISFLFLFISVVFSGCASNMQTPHLISQGDLNDESMEIFARPTEYAIETIDVASGKAYTKRFLFFTLEGDETGIPIFDDTLENMACARATNSLNGDGFYKTGTEENKISILGIYVERHVKVTGNVLKLKNLGIVDRTRADQMRRDEKLKDFDPDIKYEMLNIDNLGLHNK